MSRSVNLSGRTFNGWKVVGRGTKPEGGSPSSTAAGNCFWLCECKGCGKRQQVRRDYLCSGRSRSCRRCSKALGYWNQPRVDKRAEVQKFDEYFVDAVREFLGLDPLYAGNGIGERGGRRTGVPVDPSKRFVTLVDPWMVRS